MHKKSIRGGSPTAIWPENEGEAHTLEVTAETLYEAVAQALAALRLTDWVGDIGGGVRGRILGERI